jgi:hypothetical protein
MPGHGRGLDAAANASVSDGQGDTSSVYYEGYKNMGIEMRLFHYTDVSAVKAIFERKKLWLTDLRFMNDSEEMNHGINHILSFLDDDGVQKRLYGAHAATATEFLRDSLGEHVESYMNYNPLFVCSFSQANDLLSQWRAYGSYAVEFTADLIGQDLVSCLYDPLDKSHAAYDATLIALRGVSKYLSENGGEVSPGVHQEYSDLIKVAATLKHESFQEEQEVRMIIEKIDCDYPFLFRARAGILVPYIEVPISLKSVRSINIGPMRDQELAYRSMCMFIDEVMRLDNYVNVSPDGIAVTKSTTPFRAV